ncbi:exopolysaccharide biosynthesis protein [Thalassorhabdomicrobium marinisediminis]|nr:exopolysaccharide biosynthesis protein [Thalassorhabdomicrobium marinisediminis]
MPGTDDLLDDLQTLAQGQETVRVEEIIDRIGNRGHGPLFFIAALLVLSPLGGIPTLPTIVAVIIILIAAQMLWGGDGLWVPGFLGNRSVEADRVETAVEKMHPVAEKLDHILKRRLQKLISKPAQRAAAVVVILMALTVPFLEVVPFAAALPMAAIALIGIALTVRDGLVMLIALITAGVAVISGLMWLI